jgi:hypothetical protein
MLKHIFVVIALCFGAALGKKGYVASGTKMKPAPKIKPAVVLITVSCRVYHTLNYRIKYVWTQGSSSGIGKSTALEFAKYPEKYKVWASMRDLSKWDMREEANLKAIELDVSSDTSVASAIKSIVEEDGN